VIKQLGDVVAAHNARAYNKKDPVADKLTVIVKACSPPQEKTGPKGQFWSTMIDVRTEDGQTARVFVTDKWNVTPGQKIELANVRFFDYSEPPKTSGGGVWKNLALTASGIHPKHIPPVETASPAPQSPAPSLPNNTDAATKAGLLMQEALKVLLAAVVGNAPADPEAELIKREVDVLLPLMEEMEIAGAFSTLTQIGVDKILPPLNFPQDIKTIGRAKTLRVRICQLHEVWKKFDTLDKEATRLRICSTKDPEELRAFLNLVIGGSKPTAIPGGDAPEDVDPADDIPF